MGGISIAKKIVLYIFLVFTTLGAIPRDTYGATSCVFQVIQKKVTISMKNATLETILAEINRQTGIDYGFQSNGGGQKPTLHLGSKDVTVDEALKTLLKDSPYDYVLEKNRVVIVVKEAKPVQLVAVTGRVVDEKGNPIPGARCLSKERPKGWPRIPRDVTRSIPGRRMPCGFLSLVTRQKSYRSKGKRN